MGLGLQGPVFARLGFGRWVFFPCSHEWSVGAEKGVSAVHTQFPLQLAGEARGALLAEACDRTRPWREVEAGPGRPARGRGSNRGPGTKKPPALLPDSTGFAPRLRQQPLPRARLGWGGVGLG